MRPSLILSTLLVTLAVTSSACADDREQLRIVGSSTVFPFVSTVAEQFAEVSGGKTPVVESTGTGGGFKLFCEGAGLDTPDIADASRRITSSELETCRKNGVADIAEIKIGYDGIVIASSKQAKPVSLTKDQLFMALARKVPQQGKLVDNPYEKWSEIDSSLPEQNIEIYGPPPTSGTRDAFVEMVMEKACLTHEEYKSIPNEDGRKAACKQIREDGRYIEAGENDNIIAQKLKGNDKAFGIFGYSFLAQNQDSIQPANIEGVDPTIETISNASYPISRPLYLYVKLAHKDTLPLKEFVTEFMSEEAMGPDGFLIEKGLIPLHDKERAAIVKTAVALEKSKL